MYSNIAKEEDNKAVERWQKDADGILIFVRPRVIIRILKPINWNTVDWVFFCRRRRAACYVGSGSEVKLSGHLRILSREHLSDSRRSERHCTTHLHPFRCHYSTPILSSDVCRLGEFALVFELRDQSYLWSVGNNVTAMVAPICRDYPTTTV